MPTARELLDQADALMRRNRKRGKDRLADVPTLTDALDSDRDVALAPTLILPPMQGAADPIAVDAPHATATVEALPATVAVEALHATAAADALRETDAPSREPVDDIDSMPLDTLGDVPVLTDVVLDWPPALDAGAFGPRDPRAANVDRVAELTAERDTDAAFPAAAVDGAAEREARHDAGDAFPTSAPDGAAEREAQHDLGDAFPASAAEAEAAASAVPPPAVLESEADDVSGPAEPQVVETNAAAPRDPGSNAGGAPRVPFLDDDFILDIPPPDPNAAAEVAPSPVPAIDPRTLAVGSREWDALAEEIRMQVLQRLDLFTDTGLRDQLGARLSPIVERASAQLIETINRELGELVRSYVAEAIEREIDSWRNQNPK